MPITRRDFLATTSLALGGTRHASRSSWRPSWHPLPRAVETLPIVAFFPEAIPTETLQAFATCAIDAARGAGATYADVRVAERVRFAVGANGGAAIVSTFAIQPQFMYGVRVLVDGAWAFTHGVTPTTDSIAQVARDAIATAKGYSGLNSRHSNARRLEFTPAPIVTGAWETPMTLDPFTVPLGDQAALISACCDAVSRVRNAAVGFGSSFSWTRETRIFASSEGSLVTQRLRTSEPNIFVAAFLPDNLGALSLPPLLWSASGGYECVTRPSLQDELKQVAEESVRYLALPRRSLDVGRYPVVFDGCTLGATFSRTIGCALQLDRALGDEIGTGAGSYLSPPGDQLGTMITNPQVTVTANRAFPSITAVQWDDDGVAPQAFPLITQGRLSNYLTSRPTAAQLEGTVEGSVEGTVQHSMHPSTGCAVAADADRPVTVSLPHLTIAPAPGQGRLEELCKDIRHGLLMLNGWHATVDQQLISGMMVDPGAMLEIERGKIVRRVEGNPVQFSTTRLWQQSLVALGGADTVQHGTLRLWKGIPEMGLSHSVSAPAGLFKDVDVVSTRIRV